ncbi:MAG: PqiC family protein [Pseudomonadota bacterium]
MQYLRWPMLLSLSLGFGGCASAPDPILYTLSMPAPQLDDTRAEGMIGLSELSLPAYARNQQITTAVNDFQIKEDDNHRWAVPPSEALTSALAQMLEQETGQSVLKRPYPNGIRPELRVSVTFDRMLRGINGQAELSGQYIVSSRTSSPLVGSFSVYVPASDGSYDAYMAAMASGVEKLSRLIAADITTLE